MDKGAYLRRSVNYAAMMGSLAAKNISNIIYNRKLQSFKPFDPGWVIPVNTTSIGEAFGHGIKGRLGILMHYIICGVKNYNFSNFVSFCVSAFKFAFEKK
jgi:NADH dehydrogenase